MATRPRRAWPGRPALPCEPGPRVLDFSCLLAFESGRGLCARSRLACGVRAAASPSQTREGDAQTGARPRPAGSRADPGLSHRPGPHLVSSGRVRRTRPSPPPPPPPPGLVRRRGETVAGAEPAFTRRTLSPWFHKWSVAESEPAVRERGENHPPHCGLTDLGPPLPSCPVGSSHTGVSC